MNKKIIFFTIIVMGCSTKLNTLKHYYDIDVNKINILYDGYITQLYIDSITKYINSAHLTHNSYKFAKYRDCVLIDTISGKEISAKIAGKDLIIIGSKYFIIE